MGLPLHCMHYLWVPTYVKLKGQKTQPVNINTRRETQQQGASTSIQHTSSWAAPVDNSHAYALRGEGKWNLVHGKALFGVQHAVNTANSTKQLTWNWGLSLAAEYYTDHNLIKEDASLFYN